MVRPLSALVVEDSEDDSLLLLRELHRGGFEVDFERVETAEAMRKALKARLWDVILADYALPRFSGLKALEELKKTGLDIPFILVSGTIGEDIAINAMHMGAHDYIMKDRLGRLPAAIEREMAEAQVRRERKNAEEALRRSEMRLARINDCLVKLGTEFDENIHRLTTLCGELLEADSALYNRLNGDLLRVVGKWKTPPGFNARQKPEGHIFFNAIQRGELVVIRDLPNTVYARIDPNVSAYDLQTYVATGVYCGNDCVGSLCVIFARDFDPANEDKQVISILAAAIGNEEERQRAEKDIYQANSDLLQAYENTLEGWARALELREYEVAGHSQRAVDLTLRLACKFGIESPELDHIRRGALLHDIGKMGIPDHILHKPGPLDSDEWVVMRQHPVYAYELLSPIAYLRPALDIPYYHHERWDGLGYPSGLKGDEIPLAARLFAVVDVYDALTSDRPYRPAWPAEAAQFYLREQSGKYFDPRVVEAFLTLIEVE